MAGINSAGVVKDEDNGMYRLVTGSSGQAYNRLDLTSSLSGVITVEVGVIHKSTAGGTFANLIFLMSDKSSTPVASISFDRPGATTTLKYNDGTGWKTTKQLPGTVITYTPGEYAVVKRCSIWTTAYTTSIITVCWYSKTSAFVILPERTASLT